MWTQNKELMQFLYESAQAGYASGNKDIRVSEPDGSTSITIERGPWRSLDNWFRGEPFAGRIVVYYEGEAVWNMFYYGGLWEGVTNPEYYDFLLLALKEMPQDIPLRGPQRFELRSRSLCYQHTVGVYSHGWYGGEERIISRGRDVVYVGSYRCGPVNARK